MNGIICHQCKEMHRVTRPISVHYVDRRSSERRVFYCCGYCDSIDAWPNFTRQSPPLPKE